MTWIAILFALASLPWLIRLRHQFSVPAVALCVLVLGTVFGPAFFSLNGPVQISLDRIAWIGLMVLAAAQLGRGHVQLDRLHRLDILVALFAAWGLLSCIRFGLTTPSPPPVARWFFFIAMPSTLYFIARMVPRMTSDDGRAPAEHHLIWFANRLITTLIALTTYLAITSVFEMLDLRTLVFPRFINDPEVWEFYGRGRGPLLNPAGNGVILTLGFTACLVRFFESEHRHGKAFYVILATVAVAGAYCTLTRSVWMGVVAAFTVIGLFYVPVKFRVVAIMLALFGGVVMSTGLGESLLSLKRDKNLSAVEAAKSIELRPLLAIVAFEMFKDRPLGGHGYGQYYEASDPYHTIRDYGMPLEKVRPYMQHNVFLSVLVDLGLIGSVLHGLMLLTLFSTAWHLSRDNANGSHQRRIGFLMLGLLCGYGINGLFHAVGIIEMMHMYLFMLGGLTMTIAQQSQQHSIATAPTEPRQSNPFPNRAMSPS